MTLTTTATTLLLLGGLAGLAGCSSGQTMEDARLLPRYGIQVPPGHTTRPATSPAFLDVARVTADAGWDELRRGRLDPAMLDFNAAWRIDPSDGRTLWGMAVVETRRAERLGDKPTDRGLELLDQACRLYDDATHQPPVSVPLLLEAAGTRALRGQYRNALKDDGAAADFGVAEQYLHAAGRAGDSAALFQTWATLERARGHPAEAEAYERRAAAVPATRPASRPTAG